MDALPYHAICVTYTSRSRGPCACHSGNGGSLIGFIMHGQPNCHWLNDGLSKAVVIFSILDSNGECMLRPTDYVIAAINGSLAAQSECWAVTLPQQFSIDRYCFASFDAHLNFCYGDC